MRCSSSRRRNQSSHTDYQRWACFRMVPNDEQHTPAKAMSATFSVHSDLPWPQFPMDGTWNRITEEGHLGGFLNKSKVNMCVQRVMVGIADSIGVKKQISIRQEVEVMRNRPDFMLILVNGHPIGTIKGKQPGNLAMEHANTLGEVCDHFNVRHQHSVRAGPTQSGSSKAKWQQCVSNWTAVCYAFS